MSVYIDESYSQFSIKKKDLNAAFAAAAELVQSGKYAKHWDDSSKKQIEDASNLNEFFEAAGWETGYGSKGLERLSCPEYYNNEDILLFKAIAPYVKPGSYIDINTSDFQHFEWYFDGYTCEWKEGTMDYDSNIEIVKAILTKKEELPKLMGIHPELDKRIHETLKG